MKCFFGRPEFDTRNVSKCKLLKFFLIENLDIHFNKYECNKKLVKSLNQKNINDTIILKESHDFYSNDIKLTRFKNIYLIKTIYDFTYKFDGNDKIIPAQYICLAQANNNNLWNIFFVSENNTLKKLKNKSFDLYTHKQFKNLVKKFNKKIKPYYKEIDFIKKDSQKFYCENTVITKKNISSLLNEKLDN